MSRSYRDSKRRADHATGLVGWGSNWARWPRFYIPRYGYPKRKAMRKAYFRRPVAAKRHKLREQFEMEDVRT